LSLSLADSYIFVAVSSGIGHLYKNVVTMSTVISHIFTYYHGVAGNLLPRATEDAGELAAKGHGVEQAFMPAVSAP
jgi:hypothetical protein